MRLKEFFPPSRSRSNSFAASLSFFSSLEILFERVRSLSLSFSLLHPASRPSTASPRTRAHDRARAPHKLASKEKAKHPESVAFHSIRSILLDLSLPFPKMAAAAPAPAAPGPKLRFCPESNDLLYPQEDRERKVRNGKKRKGRRRSPPSIFLFFSQPPSFFFLFHHHQLHPPKTLTLGPGPRLPQLRLPGGRPALRTVRPPLRDPTFGPRAHRRASRRPRRPDTAVHS